jgi:tRNA nucleotidyltransferase (CCA-adding enzyme)
LELIHKHPAYPTVDRVLAVINKAGYEAVLAGGAVRDALLGVAPKDLDIATSAPPDEIERLFPSTVAVGKAFGTIVVVEDGLNFEVTTFRRDSEYVDGRHPEKVEFSSMREDAKRRDFTVNSLFYDPREERLYDFTGGLGDLSAKLLRAVGVARERFQEDHLRMLRAARFVSQLGFAMEPSAKAAIKSSCQNIQSVSSERVMNEMQRLLGGTYLHAGLTTLIETGLAPLVWPELKSFKLNELDLFPPFLSWENAYSAISLLAGADPSARLKSWKASRESQRQAVAQCESVKVLLDPKSSKAERIQALGGADYAQTLVLASGLLARSGQIAKLDDWIRDYLTVAGPSGELPKPLVTGGDLKKQGVAQSPKMGEMLKALYNAQLEGRIKTKEQALAAAKSMEGDSAI